MVLFAFSLSDSGGSGGGFSGSSDGGDSGSVGGSSGSGSGRSISSSDCGCISCYSVEVIVGAVSVNSSCVGGSGDHGDGSVCSSGFIGVDHVGFCRGHCGATRGGGCSAGDSNNVCDRGGYSGGGNGSGSTSASCSPRDVGIGVCVTYLFVDQCRVCCAACSENVICCVLSACCSQVCVFCFIVVV